MTLHTPVPAGGSGRPRSGLGAVLSTPVLRLARGRIGPAGDVDAILKSADLPASLADVVRRVVQRARLWRGERADVAVELSAHFADGLSAGRRPEELLRDFGSVRSAARLIGRAKRRGRPLAWKAYAASVAGFGWLLVAIMGVYAFLFARYMLLEPSIARNYTAEFNASVAATPMGERAWPAYRSAYLSLTPIGDGSSASFDLPDPDGGPRPLSDLLGSWDVDGADLERVRAYLALNAEGVGEARRGAALPSLGVELTDVPDAEVAAHGAAMGHVPGYAPTGEAPKRTDNPALLGLAFSHLGPMRLHARLLISDARLALEEGDAARFESDVGAVLSMARQVREAESLISDLLAIAIQTMALDAIDRALASDREFLGDDALRRLAHRVSSIGQDALLRYDGERRMFHDTVQRWFSDDGSGGGVLTRRGVREMQQLALDFGLTASTTEFRGIGDLALGPIQSAVVADRRRMASVYEGLVSHAERLSSTPLWRWDDARLPEVELERWFQDDLLRQRYVVVAMMVPAYGQIALSGERLLQRRDATLSGLALEAHRRRHGAYPASLGELVPAYLPGVPVDRFTGEPLGYRLDEAGVVLYSRGVDRDDDDGRPPAAQSNRHLGYRPDRVDQWHPREAVERMLADPDRARGVDGDWVLWPPSARTE